MDHPTHKMNAYLDNFKKWVPYCSVCSAESDLLAEKCPGEFVSAINKEVDTNKEHK